MKLVSFKKDGNLAHVKIFIDLSDFNDKLNFVWSKQKKWFNIPGFRKGKAPRGVIENAYGRDIFHSTALSLLYPKMFDLVVSETNERIAFVKEDVYMSINQQYKPVEAKKEENGVTTEFDASIYPDIPLKLEDLEVQVKKQKPVTDDMITEQQNAIQSRFGRKSLDKQYKIENGDYVKINIKSIKPVNPEADDIEKYKKFTNLNDLKILVEKDNPFSAGLIGHSIGDDPFSIPVTLPDAFKEQAGLKTSDCILECSVTRHKRLYDFAEIAEKQGFKSVDEWVGNIRSDLEEKQTKAHEKYKKHMAIESLSNMIPDEKVPAPLLDAQTKAFYEEFKKTAQQYGMDEKMFAQMVGGGEDLHDAAKKMALSPVKWKIAVENVSKQYGLDATPEEIDEYKNKIKERYLGSGEEISTEDLKFAVIESKVRKLVVEKAKFKEIEEKVKKDSDKKEEIKETSTDNKEDKKVEKKEKAEKKEKKTRTRTSKTAAKSDSKDKGENTK